MSWLCKCGLLNNGLNAGCAARLTTKWSDHYQVSHNTLDSLMVITAVRELRKENMTRQEELYAKYFNAGKIFVKDMDMTQLREHREELADIALQAKASLASADEEIREREAKNGKSDWLVTPTLYPPSTSEAINTIKLRKERMSKMDRMKEQLLKAGLDDVTVNEMIRNLERKATDKNLKTVTFQRKVTEIAAIELKIKDDTPTPNVKLFDASSLDFLKKPE